MPNQTFLRAFLRAADASNINNAKNLQILGKTRRILKNFDAAYEQYARRNFLIPNAVLQRI